MPCPIRQRRHVSLPATPKEETFGTRTRTNPITKGQKQQADRERRMRDSASPSPDWPPGRPGLRQSPSPAHGSQCNPAIICAFARRPPPPPMSLRRFPFIPCYTQGLILGKHARRPGLSLAPRPAGAPSRQGVLPRPVHRAPLRPSVRSSASSPAAALPLGGVSLKHSSAPASPPRASITCSSR
ncbi:hypothetical protein LX36DRAFT_111589 [Colletotrichum falcatum]|nr:hypothetical protein LX36DRAFT_111589 [Colletotrichum falcatum]